MSSTAIAALVVCFLFAFINGFHDGCNVIATIISSRSISPLKALIIACIAEFAGPMLLGTSVAATIGTGVVNFDLLRTLDGELAAMLLLSAVSGAIVWNMVTWWLRLPSSSSHAIVGGLMGAGLWAFGMNGVSWDVFLSKVLLVMFTSPVIGFLAGYICLKLIVSITRNMHPRTNNFIKKTQVISMFALGMSHGSNDAQKTMGIASAILLLSFKSENFVVPLWVQIISAGLMALGLTAGGWRLIKTVGTGIFSVKPIHSFGSQLGSATVIITASLIGGPVSTTQIVNSSIMGVGTAERMNAVRWDTVKNIIVSWFLTIPASALATVLIIFMLRQVFRLI